MITSNYLKDENDNMVTDFDSTAKKHILNNYLTYQNKRNLFEYTPSIGISKNVYKWSDLYYRNFSVQVRLMEDIKTDKNTSTIAQRNIDRSFQFFRYEANMNYQYQKQRKYYYYLYLGYNKNFQYPNIDQLYTIVDDINVYNTRVGNPFLRNSINHNFNMNGNFYTQKPDAVYSFNGNMGGNYTLTQDPVVDSLINDPSGRRISYYINADQSRNLNLNYNLNVSRKIKKSSIQLMYNGRYNTSRHPNYVDGEYNISQTNGLYNNFRLQFSLRTVLVLNADRTFQHYTTKQTGAGLNSFKNTNNITRLGAVLNYPTHFSFSSTMDIVSNSNLQKPTVLWNTFATYRFMKEQGELKLTAMDLLKQYQNISNNVNTYGTVTRVTNGLQQYFLLTFSYYPRKFGKTEVKKQSREVVY